MFAIIIAITGMISIPSVVPFTMQTAGIFLALLLLGGFRGTISVLIYILLGVLGLPVFSGFSSGIGILAGPTGGYIVGFILMGIVYKLIIPEIQNKQKNKQLLRKQIIALLLGLIVCYTFGTLWFVKAYMGAFSIKSVISALSICVVPFIIPDLLKMWFAFVLSSRLNKFINISKHQ
ncbi:MAG: biotin transporter BioY [Clostridiales bacterium]|nr:biotin transporter BioY [Clostridiales bacterium]